MLKSIIVERAVMVKSGVGLGRGTRRRGGRGKV